MPIKLYIFLLLFFVSKAAAADPEIFYLTWVNDPSSTMTVMWHTKTGNGPGALLYKGLSDREWFRIEGESERIVRSYIDVHRVDLKGLDADTEYLFQIEDGEIHNFHTLPDGLTRPLRVVFGGDAYHNKKIFEAMNREVASKAPDFVVLAGDIAYTEGLSSALRTHQWRVERWEEFFRIWTRDMVTENGRIIPIMPVIGNHDVKEGFDNPFQKEVIFYQVFAFPQRGYSFRMMNIGADVSFFLLDSGHTFPVGGAQAEWLEKELITNKYALYRIPAYHLAAYPSETAYTHMSSKDIRKFWCPLFEKYGVQISMEHDNHTFKRTFPIKAGMIDPDGVLYLGDGAWGVPPLKPKRHWYLAKAAQTNCYWLLTMTREKCHCEAFNIKGQLIDELTITPEKKKAISSTATLQGL